MQRRQFFQWSATGALGFGLGSNSRSNATGPFAIGSSETVRGTKSQSVAKNIIFLVSDGMSGGTLQLADLYASRKTGQRSSWMQLYETGQSPAGQPISRALMETGSANSWVTDSAAASSAWGGGVRVNNGALNVGPNGEKYQPILQKFKAAGKAVGCVTSVPITHATPAGFCINQASRGDQAEIANDYLGLKFDCMLGGGDEFFAADKRADKRDLYAEAGQAGFHVARTLTELQQTPIDMQPVLGVFHESAIPYALDHAHDPALQASVPTLAEMTRFALKRLASNPQGFVVQIEAGRVDWAAHANDTNALIHDQLAFDEAVQVALEFAAADGNTLVVITTDHGNANPGLIGTSGSNEKFDRLLDVRHTNTWVMQGLRENWQVAEIRARIEYAQGLQISAEEAQILHDHIAPLSAADRLNDRNLPFAKLANMQKKLTAVGWAGDDHSADYVELTMLGPGSESLTPFIKNYEMHNFLLQATGMLVSG
jgi:alkaline phosphatase